MSEAQFQSEGMAIASRAARGAKTKEIPNEIKLSNGIVLKVKAMPPMLLNSVANSIPEPVVPKVYIEEKDREEENPNHPAYLKALQDRQTKIGIATNDLILYACTELKHLPEGLMGPEDDRWLTFAKMAGLTVDPKDSLQRYVAWLKCYALATVDDMSKAMQVPIMLAGVSEEEVQDAMDTFRSGEGGDADIGLSPEQPSTNGNNVQDIATGGNRAARRARG